MHETKEKCIYCKKYVTTRISNEKYIIRRYCPNCFEDLEIIVKGSEENDSQ